MGFNRGFVRNGIGMGEGSWVELGGMWMCVLYIYPFFRAVLLILSLSLL